MDIRTQPRPGFTTEAKVVRIIDADTIEVEVKRTAKIRLLGCNVPDKDKVKSEEAEDWVKGIVAAYNGDVILFVPAGKDPLRIGDIHSFERILGELWIGGLNVSEQLVRLGYAEES